MRVTASARGFAQTGGGADWLRESGHVRQKIEGSGGPFDTGTSRLCGIGGEDLIRRPPRPTARGCRLPHVRLRLEQRIRLRRHVRTAIGVRQDPHRRQRPSRLRRVPGQRLQDNLMLLGRLRERRLVLLVGGGAVLSRRVPYPFGGVYHELPQGRNMGRSRARDGRLDLSRGQAEFLRGLLCLGEGDSATPGPFDVGGHAVDGIGELRLDVLAGLEAVEVEVSDVAGGLWGLYRLRFRWGAWGWCFLADGLGARWGRWSPFDARSNSFTTAGEILPCFSSMWTLAACLRLRYGTYESSLCGRRLRRDDRNGYGFCRLRPPPPPGPRRLDAGRLDGHGRGRGRLPRLQTPRLLHSREVMDSRRIVDDLQDVGACLGEVRILRQRRIGPDEEFPRIAAAVDTEMPLRDQVTGMSRLRRGVIEVTVVFPPRRPFGHVPQDIFSRRLL